MARVKRHRQVLGTRCIGSDERQIDFALHHRRKFDLGFFRRFFQALERHSILAQIDARFFFEFVDDPLHHALIEIVAAEERVAVRRFHFEHAFAERENRNIERAAAEIVHGDGFVLFLVEAVRQRRRGWLVDDAQHFQTRDAAGIFGRLALRVVKVRGHGDDRLRHLFAEIRFRVRF